MKGNQPSVAMTKRYLTAVDAILTDIKSTRDSKNYNKTATWHEKAAAQIEQFSKQGVDPAAVDAAFEAAKRLRAIGSSLRGLPIDLDALANQQYYSAAAIDRRHAGRLVGLAALYLRADAGGHKHPGDPVRNDEDDRE